MISNFSGIRIKGIASSFGSQIITAEEIANATGSPADFRKNKLGINEIRVADENETTSVLATKAVNKLEEYDKNYYRELEELISSYFAGAGVEWKESVSEINYFIVLGMSLYKTICNNILKIQDNLDSDDSEIVIK